jgi:hypothetical protein
MSSLDTLTNAGKAFVFGIVTTPSSVTTSDLISMDHSASMGVAQQVPAFDHGQATTSDLDHLAILLGETKGIANQINIPLLSEWNHRTEKRFDELAVREAMLTILPSEVEELKTLVHLRERSVKSQTAEEILKAAEYESLMSEMYGILKKFVTFSNSRPYFESQPSPFSSQKTHLSKGITISSRRY